MIGDREDNLVEVIASGSDTRIQSWNEDRDGTLPDDPHRYAPYAAMDFQAEAFVELVVTAGGGDDIVDVASFEAPSPPWSH